MINPNNKEYVSVNNNARPCYSNLSYYGARGQFQNIIVPTPATVEPVLFDILQPHSYGTPSERLMSMGNVDRYRCISYNTLDKTYGNCR